MGNLFTLNFWFNYYPLEMLPASKMVFTVLVALLLGASIIFFLIRKRNSLYRRWYGFFSANAIIGVIFWFFNFQLVPFWSARIWLLLWLLGMVWWALSILKRYQQALRRRSEALINGQNDKYLPKSKKRRK